jgi:hypothetical protein
MSYTPVDYARSHGPSTNPECVQSLHAVEAWATIVEAATQQSWEPLRARQLAEPAEWVLSVATECEAPPEVRDGLVAIGKLSRALSSQVCISRSRDPATAQSNKVARMSLSPRTLAWAVCRTGGPSSGCV